MIRIYSITNLVDGKMYIGQSTNIEKRLANHKSALNCNYHRNKHLQRAYHKYGSESFLFRVLCECSVDDLDAKERDFICRFNTIKNGYNLEGGGNLLKKISDETKRIWSEMRRGSKRKPQKKQSESYRMHIRGRSYQKNISKSCQCHIKDICPAIKVKKQVMNQS